MAVNRQTKAKIIRAIAEGRRARVTRGGHSSLPLGLGAHVLLSSTGGLTAAGKLYYARTRLEEPAAGVSMTQQPTRRGDTEYITDASGLERRARTLIDGEWQHSAIGKSSSAAGRWSMWWE